MYGYNSLQAINITYIYIFVYVCLDDVKCMMQLLRTI